MPTTNPIKPQPDHRFAFLKGFLERPKEVGSIIPSSRFMERRIVRAAAVESANLLVELGPGTGGTTRALLAAMKSDARLLVIEVNPRFVDLLEKIDDPRLIVHQGSAAGIGETLDHYALPTPDVILSGIPFSTMTLGLGRDILRSVHDSLHAGGLFVAYQVRDRVNDLGKEVFGRARVQTEIRNIPPMRVYLWEKSAA
jgi:phosphatidylethanolamine/phosphatidyl-N-methylethanolamine N-methyltransferase